MCRVGRKKALRSDPLRWLLCVVAAFFGCADGRGKTTAAKISEHFKNYEKLKQKDPVGARGELYAAAYLLHKGHSKSKLWAEKVYEMDNTGKVSFSDLLAYEILVFEIAIDNGAPKDILENHQKVIKSTRQQIEALKYEKANINLIQCLFISLGYHSFSDFCGFPEQFAS